MMHLFRYLGAAFLSAWTSTIGPLAFAATIDLVTVGNPGNGFDPRFPGLSAFGAVGYEYRIGKYEVTAGQYTEFLNAVAKDDPKGLYNPSMGDPDGLILGANIQRSGSSPNYSYSVAPDWANRPVNYVSFFDAARFVNWLHNGQPAGPQGPTTTENGAYDFVTSIPSGVYLRQAGARFWIPSVDEWYKAAYHDKSAGLAATYFDFPTGTFSAPGNDITETTSPGNNANGKNAASQFAIGAPYWRTEIGEFELSDSAYGTFDQANNVSEWSDQSGGFFNTAFMGGGFFFGTTGDSLAKNVGERIGPFSEESAIGFRVGALPIPEPSAMAFTALGSAFYLRRRRT